MEWATEILALATAGVAFMVTLLQLQKIQNSWSGGHLLFSMDRAIFADGRAVEAKEVR